MNDPITEGLREGEATAKLRAVQAEVSQLGEDVAALGQAVRRMVEQRTREKPVQTVVIALAVGWVLGRQL